MSEESNAIPHPSSRVPAPLGAAPVLPTETSSLHMASSSTCVHQVVALRVRLGPIPRLQDPYMWDIYMWLIGLTAIYVPKIRDILVPLRPLLVSAFLRSHSLSWSSAPGLISRSPLPPLPEQRRFHPSFTSVKSHHTLPEVQGDLQREHCCSPRGQKQGGPAYLPQSKFLPLPFLWR